MPAAWQRLVSVWRWLPLCNISIAILDFDHLADTKDLVSKAPSSQGTWAIMFLISLFCFTYSGLRPFFYIVFSVLSFCSHGKRPSCFGGL
jgi:hypothetical protein